MKKWLKHITLIFLSVLMFVAGIGQAGSCCTEYEKKTCVEVADSCCASGEEQHDGSDCNGACCIITQTSASYISVRTILPYTLYVAIPVSAITFSRPFPETLAIHGVNTSPLFYFTPRDYLSQLRVLII